MELDYSEIGRNVRFYRRQRSLTQKQLAEAVHVSDEHICHIETARTKLSLAAAVAIANALGVDCNALLGDTLTAARGAVLSRCLQDELSRLEPAKLELALELCRALGKYGVTKD